MAEPALQLTNLGKRFGTFNAVHALDLRVEPGEFVTLLGPSGCGKTTTLNMIAGFLQPDHGSIHLAGRTVQDLPPYRRDLGLVFQDYALFPHRSVAENIAFGLRMRQIPKPDITRRVAEAMAMVRLDGLADRRPNQLSGGQRQRVALARALVIRPALLLLDEPLSNLDLKLREEMRAEISTLQRRLAIATVFVTHDQDEALTMSDRIAVMRAGRIEQLGTARAIYERPATAFVATFIGTTNLLPAEIIGQSEGLARCTTPAGEAHVQLPPGPPINGPILLTIRPNASNSAPPPHPPQHPPPPGQHTIDHIVYLGARMEIHLRLPDGTPFIANEVNEGTTNWQPGQTVQAWFLPTSAWLVPTSPDPAA